MAGFVWLVDVACKHRHTLRFSLQEAIKEARLNRALDSANLDVEWFVSTMQRVTPYTLFGALERAGLLTSASYFKIR